MARHTMRSITGRWSLMQIAQAAGVSHRTARTVTDRGYLDSQRLQITDVLMLRVAAALLDAPRSSGLPRSGTTEDIERRNHDALTATRTLLTATRSPDPMRNVADTWLLITPTTAALEPDPFEVVRRLKGDPTSTLLLPVGRWVEELSALMASLATNENPGQRTPTSNRPDATTSGDAEARR